MCYIYFSLCKFAKFLMSFLKAQVSFPSNYASIFSAIRHNSSVTFMAQTLHTLVKGAHRNTNVLAFWHIGSIFVTFFMSILKRQVHSSSNVAQIFIFMAHNSSLIFKVIANQKPNFETFKCSGDNLRNFPCHFSNHKSVFLQRLDHSSLPWKITLLYFFSSNIIYFGHKTHKKLVRFYRYIVVL